ncbi:MAG: peroxiredoxin family protein [Anaerolineales bacterium]
MVMLNSRKCFNVFLSMLMGVIVLLMVAIAGLFIRMNQLQELVLFRLSQPQTSSHITDSIGLAIGVIAPEFSLTDANGVPVSLREFSGKWVLLGFSSTSCPACSSIYPHLRAFSQNQEGIQIILLSVGSIEENKQLADEQDFKFPVLTVNEEQLYVISDYQVSGTPFFYLIDPEGVIVNSGFANNSESLNAIVVQGAQ